jgi:glycerate kinase
MASALGYTFLDAEGQPLSPVGSALERLVRIQAPSTPVFGPDTRIEVLVDVQNPLYGPTGAAHVFAPQKGASPAVVDRLDEGLQNLALRLVADLGVDVADQPGAGAAGGLGAGLQAFLGGKLQPGIQTILELVGFDKCIAGADLILTGEGKLDGQTAGGKLISGVTAAARSAGVPVVALCGTLAADPAQLRAMGLRAAFSILDGPQTLSSALERTAELLARSAGEVIQLFRINHAEG